MKTLLFLLLVGAVALRAMSGTDRLVGEYDAIEAKPGWPAGLLALLQDPARKVGWNSWFSECPNDLEQYAFAVRTTADAQRLLEALGKVEGTKRTVVLDPGRGPRGYGEWQQNAEGREWGAVLMFGNEGVLQKWFQRLPVGADGKRHFGVHTYEKAPTASPPILTIYLGTASVEPAALVVPKGVTLVVAKTSSWPGKDYEKMVEKLAAFAETALPVKERSAR